MPQVWNLQEQERIPISCYTEDPFWVEIQSYLPVENRLTRSTLPNEYFLTIGDLKIHIDHYKPLSPRGRVILFHGVGGNGRLLSFLALPLMKNGFEVICPDMPLYGYSSYSKTVTYQTWVLSGTEIVKNLQRDSALPTFLFGLSAGGMLAYQIANEYNQINGLIVTCLLDQREKAVTISTAANRYLGMLAKPFLSVAIIFAGNVKVPMKWVSNMKAIANNDELVSLLMKDKKSSGAMIPLIFLHSMLNPIIKIEPENFRDCPILLLHPGEDRWTNIKLSNLFYDRLATKKKTVILDGAGHFPIERSGLKQMEAACIEFIEQHLNTK